MNVGKICSRPARTIGGTATLRKTAIEMLAHHVGALLVIDEEGKAVGFVTDRDIVIRGLARDHDPDEMLVTEIMSEPLETVHEDAAIETALETMAEREVRRLIVMDSSEEPVGVLSFDDLLDHFATESIEVSRLLERRQPV